MCVARLDAVETVEIRLICGRCSCCRSAVHHDYLQQSSRVPSVRCARSTQARDLRTRTVGSQKLPKELPRSPNTINKHSAYTMSMTQKEM